MSHFIFWKIICNFAMSGGRYAYSNVAHMWSLSFSAEPISGFLKLLLTSQASSMSSSCFNNHSAKPGAWHIASVPEPGGNYGITILSIIAAYGHFLCYFIHSSQQPREVFIIILILWIGKWEFRDVEKFAQSRIPWMLEPGVPPGESDLKPTPVPPSCSAFQYVFTELIC